MEYGIANVLEQYETKYKARQLLGDMASDEPSGRKNMKGREGARKLLPGGIKFKSSA
jgi:hypothetical protein